MCVIVCESCVCVCVLVCVRLRCLRECSLVFMYACVMI